MGIQSLEMTSIWDDNYLILDSNFEKPNMHKDLENAIQHYVANTIRNSNISGDEFLKNEYSDAKEKEEFEDVRNNQSNSTFVPINPNNTTQDDDIKSISEYVSNNCSSYLNKNETSEDRKVNIDPESIGSDPYSLCMLGNYVNNLEKEKMSEYQNTKVNEQNELLRKKSRNINKSINTSMKNFNLRETSIYELYDNVMITMYNIINDLTNFQATGNDLNKNIENLLKIFFANNRIMYVGIIVIAISFTIYLLDTSS